MFYVFQIQVKVEYIALTVFISGTSLNEPVFIRGSKFKDAKGTLLKIAALVIVWFNGSF
jgi:hypothetical protein